MALFTTEGLLRAHNRLLGKGICHIPSVVHHAYLRWLHTQGETSPTSGRFSQGTETWPDGWLVTLPELHHRRAPGNTCLSALHAPEMGTVDRPLNDSKGCGAVMRAAPIGLLPVDHFQLGVEIGAITHGHPSGYLSAGFLAHVVGRVHEGVDLRDAIVDGLEALDARPGSDETRTAIQRALALADDGSPNADAVESLGAGWVAEEALAISIYCALVADDFEHGILLAVNHSGDSDSTGAITGNLLGVVLGEGALPQRWLAALELRDAIERLADDVLLHRDPPPTGPDGWAEPIDWARYPGW